MSFTGTLIPMFWTFGDVSSVVGSLGGGVRDVTYKYTT